MSRGFFAALPDAVDVDGTMMPIDTDFRTYIRMGELMRCPGAEAEERAVVALEMAFGCVPPNAAAALEGLLWFYRGGAREGIGRGGRHGERLCDFRQDEALICGAFLERYGIDLYQTEHMHWWKFRALFSALGQGCELARVMAIRAARPGDMRDRDERRRLARLKETCALREDEDMSAAAGAAFAAGMQGGG